MAAADIDASETTNVIAANRELISSWMRSLHDKQPRTKDFYADEVRRFAGWLVEHGGTGDLAAVGRRDVEGWLTDLRAAGLADSTMRSRYIALCSLYGWMVSEEEIPVNPMAKIMVARGEPPPIEVLDTDQLKALLDACKGVTFYDRRDMAMIRVFISCGLRVSELCAVAIGDLDLDARIIVVKHPKGGKRTRVVRFDPATASALDRYKRVRGPTPTGLIADPVPRLPRPPVQERRSRHPRQTGRARRDRPRPSPPTPPHHGPPVAVRRRR